MKNRPLVILHGWSDSSRSFQRLARLLQEQLGRTPQLVNLADYISMDDDVTFADIVAAMMRAWRREKLPEEPGSVDVIVHSTGGLIIRDWLTTNYAPDKAPIKHLLMLAPANFGSQLAHKGRAFYGRIIKGFRGRKLFHVGKHLLRDLELASPYTWNLALKDRFGRHHYYGPGNVLCTVLVGNSGYHGISAAANEVGSDGTVRVSCANLNCAHLLADFSQDPLNPSYKLQHSNGMTAFGVLDDENHSTIAGKDAGPKNPSTLEAMVRALTVDDDDFANFCQDLDTQTAALMKNTDTNRKKQGYQNTVTFVHDQFDQHVNDYFIEFFESRSPSSKFTEEFYESVIETVHTNQQHPCFRSLYINCSTLYNIINNHWQNLNVSLTATPEYDGKRNVVGYRTFTQDEIGAIAIPKDKLDKLFSANRTILVEIKLRREQADSVFEFKH